MGTLADRQTVKVQGENTSNFESTGEPASSPCERKGAEDEERSEREELTLAKSVRFTDQSQPGWRLRNACG